ncbi:cupin domain-containing protein [Lichenicola cladoniae]|uniref:Cupin domain-containing protein n=1 Tax=Lichenicola cladoniae TaxID=1484109 RepID=A0A6M8HMT8_9PROT|nr:cupin domain-containing protein [Lichenicola cladoniae]QKE89620.1 cupin domain-containing protein [Lichenicola cladoniae]
MTSRERDSHVSLPVLSGSIELEIADRRLTSFEGDCAFLDAHIVHRLRSCDERSAAALVIIARHP